MILIQNILISEDIFDRKFVCNLQACKGACCWEGDWGAPITEEEKSILVDIRAALDPYLSGESKEKIDNEGAYTYYKEPDMYGTPLHPDGSCVYLVKDPTGVAYCGIERAWKEGNISFRKPISCHLYPIREKELPAVEMTALNYDDWELCAAACTLGKSLQVPVYEFLKESIVRRFGQEFYDELAEVARDRSNIKNT